MKKLSVIGLDLAKNVFQVHGVDEEGEVVLRKSLRRSEVLRFFARRDACLIGMEACGGAHYWAQALTRLGHTVRLMAPTFVKPYLKSNKNDRNDAEAICEAVQRPSMRFVAAKTPEQQAVLHLHHGRQLLVRQRVALNNHMRGMLLEYGISLPVGARVVSRQLPALLEDGENALPSLARHLLAELKAEHDQLVGRIEDLETQLKHWHHHSPVSRQLAGIPGIGILTATALAATMGGG
jgi:transposase